MNPIALPGKKKRRRIIVLSAASVHTGMQCLYIDVQKTAWRIIDYQCIPYPQKLNAALTGAEQNSSGQIAKLALIDRLFSTFFIECTNTLLQPLPRAERKPDLFVLNRMQLWKKAPEGLADSIWNYSPGDPQPLAGAFKIPVIYDFVRNDILRGGVGSLPLQAGDCILARQAGPIAAFINIGLSSRLTLIDNERSTTLVDSDTGPGACLINRAAKEAGCESGFDRDGSAAARGEVNTDCLEALANNEWFGIRDKKEASLEMMSSLYNEQCLRTLSPIDRLATVTALTARTISNYYYAQSVPDPKPAAFYCSGGGANNLLLMEFLSAYFSPTPVKSVEELGIPAEGRIPLSLGLTVQLALENQHARRIGNPKASGAPLGKWIFP